MLSGLGRRARGTAVVLRSLPGQRRAHYLPPDRIHELRDARVRETVRYAFETVPYYRDLERSGRIDPDDIRTAADLKRLPLIDRAVVQADPMRFVSTSKRARGAFMILTSGTTGTPLRVFHDHTSLLENIGHSERERAVESRLCAKRLRYTAVYLTAGAGTGPRVREMYRRSTLAPLRPHRVNVFAGDPVGEVIAKINLNRPDLLRSYGPYLEALFRLLDAQGIDMHLPRVACYGSGPLTEEGKQLIRERFGIPVISTYSAAECFKIGFTCERGDGFHLHEDLCVTRTVSPDGRTLPPGQRGEVVISNLVNRATVLLNYRLGDVAACQADSCGCGRTTALLSPIEGRSEDILYLPDGTFVSPRVVWRIVKDHPEALGYQLIQHDLDRFELRLVTPDQDSCRGLAGPVAARLRTILGRSAVIDVRRRDPVEQGVRKVRSVISLCGPPAR